MAEHDEAAAVYDAVAAAYRQGFREGQETLRVPLAALAAQPEPLFEGTMTELNHWSRPDLPPPPGRFVVYRAAAGSATPEEDTDG
jgi:hypothetical protein